MQTLDSAENLPMEMFVPEKGVYVLGRKDLYH